MSVSEAAATESTQPLIPAEQETPIVRGRSKECDASRNRDRPRVRSFSRSRSRQRRRDQEDGGAPSNDDEPISSDDDGKTSDQKEETNAVPNSEDVSMSDQTLTSSSIENSSSMKTTTAATSTTVAVNSTEDQSGPPAASSSSSSSMVVNHSSFSDLSLPSESDANTIATSELGGSQAASLSSFGLSSGDSSITKATTTTVDTTKDSSSSLLSSSQMNSTTNDDSKNGCSESEKFLKMEDKDVRQFCQPFSREELIELLANASAKRPYFYQRLTARFLREIYWCKLFVHGLPWTLDEAELVRYFGQFGLVRDAVILRNKQTGQSKGFGFVVFSSAEEAMAAISNGPHMLGGRMVKSDLAWRGRKDRAADIAAATSSSALNASTNAITAAASAALTGSFQSSTATAGSSSTSAHTGTVAAGNPTAASSSSVAGGPSAPRQTSSSSVTGVQSGSNPVSSGPSAGSAAALSQGLSAMIQSSSASNSRGSGVNGTTVASSAPSFLSSSVNPSTAASGIGHRMMSMMGGPSMSSTMGMSPAKSYGGGMFGRSSYQMSPSTLADVNQRRLFIASLSYQTDDLTLARAFGQFGDLEEAVVIRDRNTNASRGYGFVIYKEMASAQAALREPEKMLDGRKIKVSVANSTAAPVRRGGGTFMTLNPVAAAALPTAVGNVHHGQSGFNAAGVSTVPMTSASTASQALYGMANGYSASGMGGAAASMIGAGTTAATTANPAANNNPFLSGLTGIGAGNLVYQQVVLQQQAAAVAAQQQAVAAAAAAAATNPLLAQQILFQSQQARIAAVSSAATATNPATSGMYGVQSTTTVDPNASVPRASNPAANQQAGGQRFFR